jgi:membrane-associated phospholipid phosphatase
MDAILTLGILIVLFLQGLGAWLETPLQFFTFFGSEEFYLFFAPALFWLVDPVIGLRTGLALMISSVVNGVFKLLFVGPRPYWYDARVIPMSTETSFGVPSGHSQNAVVVWGMIAAQFHKRWLWVVAIAMMFLIGLSRLYLGMHFPHDVLLGWLIGAVLLWALLRFEKPVVTWLQRYQPLEQILIVFGASLGAILLTWLARLPLGAYTLPESWVTLAARQPGGAPIEPLALSGMVSNAGVFFGLAAGYILLRMSGSFEVKAPVVKLALRFLVGLVGVAVIWYGLGGVFPRGESLLPYLLRFIRYALVGLWIAYLAPRLFILLHLAEPKEKPALTLGEAPL